MTEDDGCVGIADAELPVVDNLNVLVWTGLLDSLNELDKRANEVGAEAEGGP